MNLRLRCVAVFAVVLLAIASASASAAGGRAGGHRRSTGPDIPIGGGPLMPPGDLPPADGA